MNKNVLNRYHCMIELLGFIFILASLVVGISAIAAGKQIPVHFDFEGNVTEYGSAGSLIVLPIVMLITIGTMSLMLHFMPFSSWNMPFKVKPGRERAVYGCIAYMLAIMELLFGIFSLAYTIFTGSGNVGHVGVFSIIFLVATLADVIVFCILAGIQNKK